jgi:hypothetical protein
MAAAAHSRPARRFLTDSGYRVDSSEDAEIDAFMRDQG